MNLPPTCTKVDEPRLDTTTVLLLLTSYVNIIRLFVILCTHVHLFLLGIALSENPSICPIPNLQFSQFPLQSGNLQGLILIQVVKNLLYQIEIALGLHPEYRLDREESSVEGILSHSDFDDLIEIVIKREESGKSTNGSGGIKSLQENIAKAEQLLRNKIAL